MKANPLTLHIRLTKHCNADCSYCSSWQESPDARLTPEALAKSVEFVLDSAPTTLGVSFTHLTAQFLGGEIAMVPPAELNNHIATIKALCARRGLDCIVGAQSNLIVSEKKAERLYDQFEGRLGTSIDLTTNARTIKGDPEKYRVIWKSADQYLRKRRSSTGAVYVVEPESTADALHHLREAARSRRVITFRPIFKGGMEAVQLNSANQFRETMLALFDEWFLRLPVIAEPFYQLCEARLSEVSNMARVQSTACAFQSDCTRKSINIEPNGDLYVCQEMADAGLAPIGNGIAGKWYSEALSLYASRSSTVHQDCAVCPFLKSCHGGCMYEAIAQGQGVHGKSYHCASWKGLFQRIDDAIAAHGAEHIHEWLHRLATRHENARAEGMAKAKAIEFEGVE
ncbi:radical SAM protein [Pseudomonas tritici]|uniref:radical SAM protein n=1 Tax=Pseudomonas tritici TaxID=2745518 RepID=UPI00387B42C5